MCQSFSSVFLSQQISQQYFLPWLISQTNKRLVENFSASCSCLNFEAVEGVFSTVDNTSYILNYIVMTFLGIYSA